MSYSVEITNEKIYNEKVVDVDLDFHKGGLNGDLAIEVKGEGEICFTGEHGANDYEEEFGFVIVAK